MVHLCSESAATVARCAWIHACRRPSRARYARAATALALIPSSGAMSLGDIPSTSLYQSTSCHRLGRLRKARAVSERSRAAMVASSSNEGSSSASASSSVVSRRDRPQEVAMLRIVVNR